MIISNELVSLDDLFAGDKQYEQYKQNTAVGTQNGGIVDGVTKGIGWENTSSAFFYRSDLASKCLNINSVAEMEEATKNTSDYLNLYDQLSNSENEVCSKMALFSYPDYQTGLLSQIGMYNVDVENQTYTIPSEFASTLEEIKDINDSKMVYSPQNDKTQIITGAQNDAFLGAIQPAWGIQNAIEMNQPGKWAIADTPLDFADTGSFLSVTTNADMSMVKEYFDMTFLNEDWVINNMELFGNVGNKEITEKYLETTDGSNEYFGGQNTVEKLAEISDEVDEVGRPVTQYTTGISDSIAEVIEGYAVNGTIKTTDEAIEQLTSKINSIYPDLTVKKE